jgi:hypothetical protein
MMVDIRHDSWSSFERGKIRRFTFGCLQYLDQGKLWGTIRRDTGYVGKFRCSLATWCRNHPKVLKVYFHSKISWRLKMPEW